MATVSDLVTESMRIASLNTSNTTESALVLAWLNDAYVRAVGLTGVFSMDASVSPSTGSDRILRTAYAPATSVSQGVITVKNVWLNASSGIGTGRALERVSVNDLLEVRTVDQTGSTDGPQKYAVRGNGDIELWPVTGASNTLTVELDVSPLVLVTGAPGSGQESTPTAILPMFHRSILSNYAIAKALQYRGLESRAAYFMGEHDKGMNELREWLTDQGGIMGPPVQVRRRSITGRFRYPDERW